MDDGLFLGATRALDGSVVAEGASTRLVMRRITLAAISSSVSGSRGAWKPSNAIGCPNRDT